MPGTVCEGDRAISPSPEASWELPAEPASVGVVRAGVRGFAHEHGAEASVLGDLALAVTEAVTNAVLHAFIDLPRGTIHTEIRAGRDELVVTVTDDGRGMQPRADSPGLGLGLPTIGRLTTAMDVHAPDGGGTALTMTFAAAGVRGPGSRVPGLAHETELLDAVARTVEGAWPGEGVERLVDLLVPGLADACALDVIADSGDPERFAGRIDGPDGARQSAWLASLRPRVDSPQSATRLTLHEGGLHVAELTPEHIARITASDADAEQMAATDIRWWVVVPLLADDRLLGLIHFGMRAERGRPPRTLLDLLQAVAERASRALINTELIAELRRTRRRFERILDVLAEAVTVQDASGRLVYANEAAARLLGPASPAELIAADGAELSELFAITRADGTAVRFEDLPSTRLLAGLDAPPLLTRSVLRSTGQERWLLTKATLLEDGERLAVNIIEDVTNAADRGDRS